MLGVNFLALEKGVALVVFTVLVAAAPAVAGQCIDSSQVNDFKVRSVAFRSLFGRVPAKLRLQLEGYKGQSYSAAQASKYIREINQFLDNDPIQQRYEALIPTSSNFPSRVPTPSWNVSKRHLRRIANRHFQERWLLSVWTLPFADTQLRSTVSTQVHSCCSFPSPPSLPCTKHCPARYLLSIRTLI